MSTHTSTASASATTNVGTVVAHADTILANGPVEASSLYDMLSAEYGIPRHHIAFAVANQVAHGHWNLDGDLNLSLVSESR